MVYKKCDKAKKVTLDPAIVWKIKVFDTLWPLLKQVWADYKKKVILSALVNAKKPEEIDPLFAEMEKALNSLNKQQKRIQNR